MSKSAMQVKAVVNFLGAGLQVNAGLMGDMKLSLVPKPSDTGYTLQMSPADSNVSSQAPLSNMGLAPEQAQTDWQRASFEVADDKTLEVRKAMFDGLVTSPFAAQQVKIESQSVPNLA